MRFAVPKRRLIAVLLLLPLCALAETPVSVMPLGEVLVDYERRAPAEVAPLNEAILSAEVNAVVLAVEDDAPLSGVRESYLVDIMRPCWLWRDADLTNIAAISASVGQLPFNFQLGKDLANVVVLPPETEAGELVVQLHSCDGPVVATLPLAPAVDQFGASTLPSAPLAPMACSAGQADLCLRFRRPALDPYWALGWLRLEPKP